MYYTVLYNCYGYSSSMHQYYWQYSRYYTVMYVSSDYASSRVENMSFRRQYMLIIFSTLYLPSQLSTMMVEVDSIQCVVQYISNNNHYNNDSFLFIPCENKQGSEYICSMQYTCNSVYVIVQQCIYVQCQYVYVQSIQNQFNNRAKKQAFQSLLYVQVYQKGLCSYKNKQYYFKCVSML